MRGDAEMDLKDHFENTRGRGVLATADRKGKVDAAYLFMESGQGFVGKRLFLTKIRDKQDTDLAHKLRRRAYPDDRKEPLFLLFFHVDKLLPFIGPGEEE